MKPSTMLADVEELTGAKDFARTFDRLPLRMIPGQVAGNGPGTAAMPSLADILGRMGFEVGEPIADRHYPDRAPLFMAVTPPPGWSLEAGEDKVLTRILDERGVERGTVSFKASLHDRRATITVHNRFEVTRLLTDATGERTTWSGAATHDRWVVLDRETDSVAHAGDLLPILNFDEGNPEPSLANLKLGEASRSGCGEWLADNAPDVDPTAYWGIEPSAKPSP